MVSGLDKSSFSATVFSKARSFQGFCRTKIKWVINDSGLIAHFAATEQSDHRIRLKGDIYHINKIITINKHQNIDDEVIFTVEFEKKGSRETISVAGSDC